MIEENEVYDIAVIGGGVSGMVAAIAAKREAPALSAIILERLDRVGKKLSVTGNGRCNITNRDIDGSRYHGGDRTFITDVLGRVTQDDTIRFLDSIGVLVKFDETGRGYPYSLQASSVVDALRFEAERLSVMTRCNSEVLKITAGKNGFLLLVKGQAPITAKIIILAAGGSAAPKLGTDGSGCRLLKSFSHKITTVSPAIVQLKTENILTRQLKGIKIEGTVTILSKDDRPLGMDSGEVLFTDYGLSGPPVYQLSRFASGTGEECAASIVLDLMPEYSLGEVYRICERRARADPERPLNEFFTGILHKRLGSVLIKSCGFGQNTLAGQLEPANYKILAGAIKKFTFKITGTTGFPNAQVTAGGADLSDFDRTSMSSRKEKGLYACGEVLDVDGDCGGFNLQWAFSSGYLAGISAARELNKEK